MMVKRERVRAGSKRVGARPFFIYARGMTKRLVVILVVVVAGLFGAGVGEAAGCAWRNGTLVCGPSKEAPPFETPEPPRESILDGVTYGWVEDYARFYAAPEVEADWVRTASAGIFYGPVEDQATDEEGNAWLKVWGNWLPARYFHEKPASTFAGVKVNAQPQRPFGWVLREFETQAEPGNPDTVESTVERYDFVEVYERAIGLDGAVWYDIGEGTWVRYHALALLALREPPRGVEADAFWVDVDLSQQTFAAYEGERLVFAGLISSGLPRWPTRRGLFRVYRTHLTTPMSGGEVGDDYYYLEDVPHTMYFDKAIALHGAYWHDDFGRPKSHGCVNIAPRAAEWLYEWAMGAPGDLRVWVHNSHHGEFGR